MVLGCYCKEGKYKNVQPLESNVWNCVCHIQVIRYLQCLFNDPNGKEHYRLLDWEFTGNHHGFYASHSDDLTDFFRKTDLLNYISMMLASGSSKGLTDMNWFDVDHCRKGVGFDPCMCWKCRLECYNLGKSYQIPGRFPCKSFFEVDSAPTLRQMMFRCKRVAHNLMDSFVAHIKRKRANATSDDEVMIIQPSARRHWPRL